MTDEAWSKGRVSFMSQHFNKKGKILIQRAIIFSFHEVEASHLANKREKVESTPISLLRQA